MKMHWMAVPCLALCTSCLSGWSSSDALTAEMVEMQVDSWGRTTEIEYHIAPDAVPMAVRDAMDRLHPGGEAIAAEKEYAGSVIYWELTKRIDGKEIEALFKPDGTLHSEEIEVDASSVPEEVKHAVAARMDGEVTKWEEIRDGKRELVEYHTKLTSKGMKYKIRTKPDGEILGVVREVQAEIEVPVE